LESAGSPACGTERVLAVDVRLPLPGFALDVNWTAEERVVALVGPSGSGKSLTLHCVAGLMRPAAGRITVNERMLFDASRHVELPTRARRIGYVFQGYALFPHLSVADNVAYGLRGRPRRARAQRTAEVLGRLGLTDLAPRFPGEISGGQQQRVALGRALAADPELLLLDEPFSALDAPLRRRLRRELAQVIRDWGLPTVIVTHDLADVAHLADRVVVYDQGRVLEAARTAELFARPSSARVAELLGLRNLLWGTVVDAATDRLTLSWRGQTLEAATAPARGFRPPPGTRLPFLIRPESVRLIRKDRPGPDPERHPNLMTGELVGELDEGAVWCLLFRLKAEGAPAHDTHDLEIEIPKLVYELLEVARVRQWQVSVHRGAIQVLAPADPSGAASEAAR
jgi:molybdate transport system ATP-binding protein